MSQKVHPKGFRLRTTPGFTKSKTALGKGITLADTQHETEACLNTPQGGLKAKPLHSAFDSVWFSDPKKGKHSYTRLSHEDQLIQTYTKGFFRSFGFYQQKCVIERKCNKELHITSYVLRTPKLQPSKLDILGTRTRQEKTQSKLVIFVQICRH